ncbi:MAG: hypothetical protein HY744_28525 [Deltaproteobacteria bacterium]|nr:hypothetical protein [Deltaproteobacteria bacterium]
MRGRGKKADGEGAGPRAIPKEVREAVLCRLEPEQRRYLVSGEATSFELTFRDDLLYVAARRPSGPFGERRRASPLCRLRYTGNTEQWRLEIYRYSTGAYDVEQDFPFGSGTPEECFAVAADFYVWEYDALSAGASLGKKPRGSRRDTPEGPGAVLPPLAGGPIASCPRLPQQVRAEARGRLVDDFSAFLGFVQGRRFDLAPRAFGFRRHDLAEVNARMSRPQTLHARAAQDGVPRVQCCFAVAEALGLLDVSRALHRAEGTAHIARFLGRPVHERWWAVLEALWQRVSWPTLRRDARGWTELHQAARWWLGRELGRRTESLRFDWRLGRRAEVLDTFLLPSWRDAGLLVLRFDERSRQEWHRRTHVPWSGLCEVEITDVGRWSFAQLAAVSPRGPEADSLDDPNDGRWPGDEFLERLHEAAPDFDRS